MHRRAGDGAALTASTRFNGGGDVVDFEANFFRRMSWKGVLAGAFCITAFGDLLVMLGVAVGLAAWHPGVGGWDGVVGAIGGGAWTTVAIVAATVVGAYISVRMTPDLGRGD